jgi:hypothetical protein
MSDEIIDVNAEEVPEEEQKYMLAMEKDIPKEKLAPSGENIPDPDFVEVSQQSMEINSRRQETADTIPSYPSEWQSGYTENTKGFDDTVDPLKLNISFKEKEMKKIIKKYKRYMKNTITEVKRLES